MKPIVIIISILIIGNYVTKAQVYVDGENLNEMDIEVCGVYFPTQKYSGVLNVIVNYGQKYKVLTSKYNITNQAGEVIEFYSEVGVINHMLKNGWEILDIVVYKEDHPKMYFRKEK